MTGSLLVGDIGGTNVRLGIAHLLDDKIEVDHFQAFEGDKCIDFYDALDEYRARLGGLPDIASLAFAGPVQGDEVQLTNRNWHISATALRDRFGFTHVTLLNDFAAMARAVPELVAEHLHSIRAGAPHPDAPRLVAGPGTGFGVATLARTNNNDWLILQGEGGHMAFSPRTELDVEIARILQSEHGYVSTELVASGSGLPAVHKAFCTLYDRPYTDIPPGEMLAHAKTGDKMFLALCKLRARTVMSAVGDLVLANGARGGVVLAGGVSQRLAPYFADEDVAPYFNQRGTLSKYLDTCPVSLMTDPHAPLIGAAAYCQII